MDGQAAPRVQSPDLPRRAAALGAAAILVLGACGQALATGDRQPVGRQSIDLPVWTGGEKPAFHLDDLNKRALSLGAHAGQVVLVHFFATWCEPCIVEFPALRRLMERADPADLRVLAISVGEVDARVRNFADRMEINFPVLLDRDRSVAKAWGVHALPTTYILGRDLTPRYFIERDYDWDELDIPALLTDLSARQGSGER